MPSLHIAQELKDVISDLMHPVGSVYIAVDDTDPSTLFYGTWTRIVDGYLFCSAAGYSGIQANLVNGTRTGDHKLTINEIPSHDHKGLAWWGDTNSQSITLNGGGSSGYNLPYSGGNNAGDQTAIYTRKSGNDGVHSHPMPTTMVSVWKRTA